METLLTVIEELKYGNPDLIQALKVELTREQKMINALIEKLKQVN